MTRKNADGSPTEQSIRNDGAIPWVSQIPNNSTVRGENLDDVLNNIGSQKVIKVAGVSIETLNDEESTAIGGLSTDQFAPVTAIVHMEDVGAGAAANGDVQISIGITTGGTEILAATACTNLIGINTKFIIDLSAVVKPAMPANSTIYVKVTTADTTAGAGHLADVYVIGHMFPSGT